MRLRHALTLCVGLILFATSPGLAKNDALTVERYIEPVKAITDIVTAPRHTNVNLTNLSPDRTQFLIVDTGGLPALADFARPHYNLGGVQIDPIANRARTMTTSGSVAMSLFNWRERRSTDVKIPSGATFTGATWSTSGKQIAFIANFENASYVYVADTATGNSRRLSSSPLLATSVNSIEWTSDDKWIVAVLVPENRGVAPTPNPVPTEPLVRVTQSGNKTLRTFPSLLSGPKEAEMLEFYLTGQLAMIEVATGNVKKIGAPAMFRSVNAAPDGSVFRVTILEKPFSYIVPVSSFGSVQALWDPSGKEVHVISRTPLREGAGGGGGGAGAGRGGQQQEESRRSLSWRPDGNGMSFLQMEPAAGRGSGEQGEQAPRKDRVMQWLPPYDESSAKVVYESENRINSVDYSADCKWLFITETASGQEHVYAVHLDNPETQYTISRRRTEEFYENPGSLMSMRGPLGVPCVRISSDGRSVYLSGIRYSRDPVNEAPRPFVDSVNIRSGEKRRMFESSEDAYETVSSVLDDDFNQIIIQRQSRYAIPNCFLRNSNGNEIPLTQNIDYAPDVTYAQRFRTQVTRADGFKFWVNVTLPKDWTPGNKLPALFWFYPREFTDQRAYDNGNRTFNKNSFPSVGTRSVSMLVLLGYAVVEPDCPIVGPTGRMNDRYIPDLRSNLYTVITALDREGMIDIDRLAIGGHSYGAFSAVNAMVHTPFFKAGIAGDGAYNRLLTPAGFQSESRMLWDARETYLEMSPFLYLERITGAVLLYHGMDDQNVGTFPINSERLYHALEVMGKPASLYMYPYEDHSPATKESNLDLWARWIAWLDKYLKGEGN
ncbi:MAG: S9 family peptidase [Fimbriimonadales bacterium]|nr:S9 family peptidase [Fimbriimonadales bacterium]